MHPIEDLAVAVVKAQLIVFDHDGVMYPIHDELHAKFRWAIAHAVVGLGVPLTVQQAERLAKKSYDERGSSLALFLEKYGIDQPLLHELYHARVSVETIPKCTTTSELMRQFELSKCILSHGHYDWVHRGLVHLDYRLHFKDDHIFPFEAVGFASKEKSTMAYQHVLTYMGADASRTIMIEDSVRNLLHAKMLGMTTVLFTYGKTLTPADYPYVDYFVPDLKTFLMAVLPPEKTQLYRPEKPKSGVHSIHLPH